MPSKQRSILRFGLAGWVLLWVWMCSTPLSWADGKMGYVLQRAVTAGSDAESLNAIPGVFYREGTPYVRLHMKLSEVSPELEQAGVELRTRSGDVYTAAVPVDRLSEVAAMPQVVRMEAVQKGKPLLEISVPDIRANEVWTNNKWGNQGEGVLVGMVDTGIFYQHEAFLDEQGDNRILYIWDNTTDTECDPQSIRDESCAETDGNGHGTAVMGVIAGAGSDACQGRTDPCVGRGVAPRANIVVVKSADLWSDEVIDGVAYIFDKARDLNMPAVVNLSLGFFAGPRDGTSLIEESISDLTGPGKIVVAAAGNEALMRGHAKVSVSQGRDAFVFSVVGQGAFLQEGEIEGWYDAREDDPNDVEVRVLAFTEPATDWLEYGEIQTDVAAPAPYSGTLSLYHTSTVESETRRGFFVRIVNAQPIEWRIQIRKTGQGEEEIHLWINPMTFAPPLIGELPKFRFTTEHTTEWARTTVTPPCTAENVICVASYNTNCDVPDPDVCSGVGESEQTISSFSSQGPRRDGRIGWPWIAAPGQAILSASTDGENQYGYWKGTSLSSPHVAGTVALMFGASLHNAWNYSVSDIKGFLKDSARDDGNRDVWGWGKLGALGAVSALFSTLPPPPPPVPQGLDGDDDFCFIATAAFGNIDAPQVRLLREMRDRSLLKRSWGRGFVRLYYRLSPPVAAWLKEHTLASRLVRVSLLPAVGWSEMVYHRSRAERAILFGLGLSLVSVVCYFSVRRRTR